MSTLCQQIDRQRPVDHRSEPGLVGADSPRANWNAEQEDKV